MKLSTFFLFTTSLLTFQSYSQCNLVVNGDFETYTTCPTANSQINNATGWDNANSPTTIVYPTADYMNCSFNSIAGQPAVTAHSGTGFIGINATSSSGSGNGAEMVGTCVNLIAGNSYTFSFWTRGVFDSGGNDPLYLKGTTSGIFPVASSGGYCPLSMTTLVTIPKADVYNSTWTLRTYTFTSPANFGGIIIGGVCGSTSNYFIYIDDVSLTSNTLTSYGSLTATSTTTPLCGTTSGTVRVNLPGNCNGPYDITYTVNGTPTTINNINDGHIITVPLSSGNTTVSLTSVATNSGCITAPSSTILFSPTSTITANAGANQLNNCSNPTHTLTGSQTGGIGTITYGWSPSTGLSSTSSATPTANPSTTTNYTLTVTDANGCSATDMVTVTVDKTAPTANAGPDINLDCSTTTGAFVGTGGASYSWNTPSGTVTGSTINITTASMAGNYTLTATAANGCTDTDIATLSINLATPTANAGNNQILDCNTLSVNLDGSSSSSGANISYSWTTSTGNITGSTSNNTTTANLDGTYTLTVSNTSNGCSATDAVTVTQDTITPVGIISNAPHILDCNNPSIIIDASSSLGTGNSYTWTTATGNIVSGANTSNPTVDLIGSYSLNIISANGCTNIQPINEIVTIDTISPTIAIASPDTLTCTILDIDLDASGSQAGVMYQWTTTNGSIINGDQTSTPTIGSSGDYTLVVTSANGCTSQMTINVVNSVPPIALLFSDTIEGDQPLPVSFTDASTGINIDYYLEFGNGDDINANSADYTYTEVGEYDAILTVTDQYNCTHSDTIRITVNKLEFVVVPNGVSRNSDGLNDLFFIKNLHYFPENELKLYNRWGDLIFQAQPYINNWDGSSSTQGNTTGQEATSGTYFYMLKLYPDSDPMTGYVELKR